jgi:cyclophilin family peptidyl-prolyl cis-trans isomerase
MKFIRILVSLSLFAFALSLVSAQTTQTPQEVCDATEPGELAEMQFEAAEEVLEDGIDYHTILCTDTGAIYIDLLEDEAPITVNNWVFLAQEGYFDGTTFHRVIPNFMAQGGDPTATGRGGPGYRFEDEFVDSLTFDNPGLLAMANSGPATNGSQFFITTAPTPHLTGVHTIYGRVVNGQENVVAIRLRDPQSDPNPGTSLNNVIIVTDPSTINAAYTVDDMVAGFENFAAQLPPQLPVDETVSGLFTTEETVAGVPEAFQEDFATFAEAYGHEFRYTNRIMNGDCEPSLPFTFLRYTIDAMESVESATDALADDFPMELATANGFEVVDGVDNTYQLNMATCSDSPGVYGMTLYTRGRYLITVEALAPVEILEQVDIEALLVRDVAAPFEGIFAPMFLSELESE